NEVKEVNKKISILLVLLLCLSTVPLNAESDNSVTIRAPAVSKTPEGYIGAVLSISITTEPGNGHIYVDTWPLTELDTQASVRLAVEVAGRVTGRDISKYNFYYIVRSDSPVIGGPSAGGVMTVATIAALNNWELRDDVMMTGMINPDGSTGPVGGIKEKLDASAKLGVTKFLVPWGQTIVTTQTTTKEERGGIVQITEEPKKIDLVKYAEEEYGIEVIEVKDIKEALYYFTGRKFQEKKIEGEIKINTDFFSEKAEKALERNKEYLKETEGGLKSLNLSESENNYFEEYLDTAEKLIGEAEKKMEEGKYYTALSILLNAEISTGVVDEYTHADNIDARIKELEEKIDDIDTDMKEKRKNIRGITSFEFLSAAEKRLKEAYDYLSLAKKNDSILDGVYNIAYADKRADTVTLWLDLAVEHSEGEKIPLEELKGDAWKRIEEAKLVYVYVESMVGSTALLQDASQSLSSAQSEYDAGRYTSSLFYAIESYITSGIAIELGIGGDDPQIIDEKIQQTKEGAELAIERSREEGHEPMLAECYYEYGTNFEENEDAVNAFRMYKYSREVALAYKHIGTEGIETPAVTTEKTSKSAEVSIDQTQLMIIFGSGLIGLFIGILIGTVFSKKK
ncbi:MAG: S16 family serine protease, partial [Euryarchaeota archaeon]|nr:S16 family serine protease [Euryarchaeota archaeon]